MQAGYNENIWLWKIKQQKDVQRNRNVIYLSQPNTWGCEGQTERQTDGQTERWWILKVIPTYQPVHLGTQNKTQKNYMFLLSVQPCDFTLTRLPTHHHGPLTTIANIFTLVAEVPAFVSWRDLRTAGSSGQTGQSWPPWGHDVSVSPPLTAPACTEPQVRALPPADLPNLDMENDNVYGSDHRNWWDRIGV